jgi:hypothetical protein
MLDFKAWKHDSEFLVDTTVYSLFVNYKWNIIKSVYFAIAAMM